MSTSHIPEFLDVKGNVARDDPPILISARLPNSIIAEATSSDSGKKVDWTLHRGFVKSDSIPATSRFVTIRDSPEIPFERVTTIPEVPIVDHFDSEKSRDAFMIWQSYRVLGLRSVVYSFASQNQKSVVILLLASWLTCIASFWTKIVLSFVTEVLLGTASSLLWFVDSTFTTLLVLPIFILPPIIVVAFILLIKYNSAKSHSNDAKWLPSLSLIDVERVAVQLYKTNGIADAALFILIEFCSRFVHLISLMKCRCR